MAKIRTTTGKPVNVIEKERNIDRKCTEEILPTLPSFISEYYSFLDAEERSVKTRYAYLVDLSLFFEYMIGGTGLTETTEKKGITLSDMEKLKAKDVNDYLAYCKEYEVDGVIYQNGKAARARKRSSIVGLLSYLYKNDMIEYDVTGKILSVSVSDKEKSVKALQENEIMELLDVVCTGNGLTDKQKVFWEKTKYRDKLIIELFVNYGLRISELQQLNISSFNLKRGEFTIYRKRAKESVMPMNKSITMVFNEYLANDRNNIIDIYPGDEDALFLCLHTENVDAEGNRQASGRKRLSITQIRDLVKKYTAVVIGGSGYSPHKLRASAATSAIRRGTDIFRVANLLDQDNIQTTQKYLQKNQHDKEEVLKSMEMEIERTEL